MANGIAEVHIKPIAIPGTKRSNGEGGADPHAAVQVQLRGLILCANECQLFSSATAIQ